MVLRRRFTVQAFCIVLVLLAGPSLFCSSSMAPAAAGVNPCTPGFVEKAAPADAGCCCEKEKGAKTCSGLQGGCANGEGNTSPAAAPGTGSIVPAPGIVSTYQPPARPGRALAPVVAAMRETTYLVNLNLLC